MDQIATPKLKPTDVKMEESAGKVKFVIKNLNIISIDVIYTCFSFSFEDIIRDKKKYIR